MNRGGERGTAAGDEEGIHTTPPPIYIYNVIYIVSYVIYIIMYNGMHMCSVLKKNP